MVLRSSVQLSPAWQSTLHHFRKPIAGLLITLGLLGASSSLVAQSATAPANSLQAQASQRRTLPDGVYLYGQSEQPDQIGSAYMVFRVSQNRVVGAFYMPFSSFDCFNGEFQTDRLALNVVDSYEQTVHPYSVALQSDASVASATGAVAVPVGLEGFHRLQAVSDNDQRILATCQADSNHPNSSHSEVE